MEMTPKQIAESALKGSQWTKDEMEAMREGNVLLSQVLARMQPSLDLMKSLESDLLLHGVTTVYGGNRISISD